MNNIDRQYKELLDHILRFGVDKADRTGTGTKSIFGWQIRHNMKEGFPLLTTKKMAWKTMVTELLWFLRGDTNIKYLVDNNCHIWDGDAYQGYLKRINGGLEPASKERFIEMIKNNEESRVDANGWKIGELGPIYGKQWRNWNGKPEQISNYGGGDVNPYFCDCQELFEDGHSKVRKKNKGIDQIANLISELKTNPDSRRLMVSAWNVSDLDQMVLPPCHYGFQVYTRELDETERVKLMDKHLGLTEKDKLPQYYTVKELENNNIPTRAISLMWNQRSVDTFLGLPFNIASYALLLEIIAKAVNMVPEDLIGNLGDVHLYNNHIEQAKEQITRTPFELPKLNINTEFWPTESGSCGEGSLDATAVFNSFKDDNFCKCLLEEDIQLFNYQSHPSIKAPLSN
jgi:thymidylate synthase